MPSEVKADLQSGLEVACAFNNEVRRDGGGQEIPTKPGVRTETKRAEPR